MNLFPAIDLVQGKAVRLFKGDYAQMTVYNEDPTAVAQDFETCGAKFLHLVDLEGAKNGTTPNLETVKAIRKSCDLFIEIGGGIRSMETIEAYLSAGINRVILGTAAVRDPDFLKSALAAYGEKIAVGVDLKDGEVAVQGWTERSGLEGIAFCRQLEQMGVSTLICTDISKDGAMKGTNRDLYQQLANDLHLNITASGGVSTLEDVKALAEMQLYGAIIGKAYYTGAIDLREALEVAR